MGFEYMGPLPDPDADRYEQVPTQKLPSTAKTDDDRPGAKNSALPDDDHTQPLPPLSAPRSSANEPEYYQEPSYREHVSGSLVLHPADAPYFRPAYQAYQPPTQQQQQAEQPSPPIPQYQPTLAFPGYPPPAAQPQTAQNNNAYQPAGYSLYAPYPGYPPYPYPYTWQPERPKRDSYLLAISIASFIGAILVVLVGLGSALILLFMATFPNMRGLPASQQFSGIVAFTAFAGACLVGGSFSLYHSIRSLFFRRSSADFKLPWFWIFLALYAVVIAAASTLRYNGQAISNISLTVFLIALAGLLPAITVVALGVRRLHYPREARWPTSWRRFTLALVSGMTSAIVFAAIFEVAFTFLITREMGLTGLPLDDPNQPIPQNPRAIALLFILVSVIAPLVEEAVKPLAVVALIGRVQSAAEAFVLGLACGIGFDFIETSGYISMGYRDWLDVALERSSAGLLHGFGAAMVALGWYYLTNPKSAKHHVLLGIGCGTYAVLQHAIWNGSFGLQLLPAPLGPYLDNGVITISSLSFPSFTLVSIVETVLMLIFFFYVTGKLRGKKSKSRPSGNEQRQQPPSEAQMITRR